MARVALAAATAPAHADWLRAETRHFIVYDNARDAEVRALASDLERFDGFIRLFHDAPEVDGASRSPTIRTPPPTIRRRARSPGSTRRTRQER